MTTSYLTGKGIGVAVLDTGIFPHIDMKSRIIGFYDVINNKISAYDDNSHGTHVAGIVAGDGTASDGRYAGTATGANLIGVRILGKSGKGSSTDALKGIEWVLKNRRKYDIRVVNISFSTDVDEENDEEHPLIKAVEELWSSGIVVVTAAGNEGPQEGTIGIPGICRRIITVGAYDTLYGKDSAGNVREFFSGRGNSMLPYIKPEIVARGSKIISCSNSMYGYVSKSGSSMAAPYVSGMIARLIEKYPDMEPIDVKLRLHARAVNLGKSVDVQGWGTIDDSLF